MKYRRIVPFVSVLVGTALLFALPCVASEAPAVSYTVSMPVPVSHFFHVTARIPGVGDKGVSFAFPAWEPGGYIIREVAANVLRFRATDGLGQSLPARKVDKQTWKIPRGSDDTVVVRYLLYADDRGRPYSARLNARLGHMNLARVLGYVPDRLRAPAMLTIEPYGDWKVACSLEPMEGAANTFRAPDYDTLADGIVIAGRWYEMGFDEGGAHFRVVFSEQPKVEDQDVTGDLRSIAREEAAVFGLMPFSRYLFVFLVEPGGGHGGIEHLYGTSISIGRDAFSSRGKYRGFLGVAAHELFHAWNVKRLRPKGLGPFDYTREVHTPLLYVAEGFTSYYGPLAQVRGGATEPKEFYGTLGRDVGGDRNDVGIRYKNLEQLSWDSWLETSIPFLSFRSYYRRGTLAAMILDLHLRAATKGKRSLDDVMRTLYRKTATFPEGGFDTSDLRAELVAAGGEEIGTLFDRLRTQTGPLPAKPALELAGLEVVADPDAKPVPHHGLHLAQEEESKLTRVQWVEPGSPAEKGGLQSRDVLLAVNGRRVGPKNFRKRIRDAGAGKQVTISFYRDGELQSARVKLGEAEPTRWVVRPVDKPTKAQKAVLEGWLASRAAD